MEVSTPIPSTAQSLATASSRQRIILRPRTGWQPVNLKELWNYRELLFILAMRDVKVRYKQAALGIAWAVLQPFLTMLVFWIFFAKYAGIPTDPFPPPLLFFCKLLPWQLFASSLTQAGNSLVGNQNLITKIYFPRLVIPISAVVTGLIDFAIAFVMLLLMMLWFQWPIGLHVLAMPLFVLMAFVAALAVGLWLSALNVEFRDVRYVLPFLTQFWMFITPVIYMAETIPAGWKRTLMGLNPMSGVVEGFRWAMLGGNPPDAILWVSIATILVLLVTGLLYFRRMEKSFADIV
jgi:lipopolysaccharide transport system permease protein